MNIVLFDAGETDRPLPLYDPRARHIVKILRKGAGDSFEAGIVNGNSGRAVIRGITETELLFDFVPSGDGRPLYPVRLIVGFPRPIQLKRLLRDAASLGVGEVHLAGTELGEKSYMKSTLVERGAAEVSLREGSSQAKSTHVPSLFMHESVPQCLASLERGGGTRLVMDNISPEIPLSRLEERLPAEKLAVPVYAAVGSERGWTDSERRALCAAGFLPCSLGKRVLRTETAVTVCISLILSKLGYI